MIKYAKNLISKYSNQKLFLISNFLFLLILSIVLGNFNVLFICFLPIILIAFYMNVDEKNYFHIFLISIILIAAVLLLYYGYIGKYGSPYYMGGSDDLDFEEYARYVISKNSYTPIQVYIDLYWYVAKGFVWFVSIIMRLCSIFGTYHTIIPRILNVYCLLAVGILSQKYYIKKCSNSHIKSLIILYAVSLYPNAVYISANLFRDIWVLLGIFLIFYIYDLEIFFESKIKLFFITLIISFFSFFIRSQSILIIIAEICIILFLKNKEKINQFILELRQKTVNRKNTILFISFIVALIPLFLYVAYEITRFVNIYSSYLASQQNGLSNFVFRTPILPFGIILRFLYGIISPFPNGILNVLNIFEDIDVFWNTIISFFVFVQIILIPFLFFSFKKIKSYNLIWLLIFLTVIISTFTFRHFLLFYPFMWLSIFDCYFSLGNILKKKIFQIWIFVIFVLGIIYLSIIYI